MKETIQQLIAARLTLQATTAAQQKALTAYVQAEDDYLARLGGRDIAFAFGNLVVKPAEDYYDKLPGDRLEFNKITRLDQEGQDGNEG